MALFVIVLMPVLDPIESNLLDQNIETLHGIES